MVREGARHIVLASRSGLPATEDQAGAARHSCRAQRTSSSRGATSPTTTTCSASSPDPGLDATAQGCDPHRDGARRRRSGATRLASFRGRARAQSRGVWNLHELTRDDDLECFVLFSSVSALTGPPTQSSYAAANSFLGALAAYRRAEGRPAVAIDWGMISDVGYVAWSPVAERRLTRYGLGTKGITADQACSTLERIIRHGVTRVAVSRTNLTEWSRRDAVDSTIATPRVERKDDVGRPGAISARLVAVPAADRPAMLEQYLLQRTAMVLDTVAERVEPRSTVARHGIRLAHGRGIARRNPVRPPRRGANRGSARVAESTPARSRGSPTNVPRWA